MTTPALLDLAAETVSSAPGTGSTISLSGTAQAGGYLKWSDAGAVNGVTYRLQIIDGTSRELATAVYNSSGNQFTSRTTLVASVAGTKQTSAINATSGAVICANALAEDFSGRYLGKNVYASSQTVTIPNFATSAEVQLWGGSGGCLATGVCCGTDNGASGAAGYLEKRLTGLTRGNTLTLTIGAAGGTTPTAGGNSSLASGTQSISTLTANGSAAAVGVLGAPGTASGGDLNVTGGQASNTLTAANFMTNPVAIASANIIGATPGGGSASIGGTGVAGAPGLCIIKWYA
jgi:hypothetical protein